MRPYVITFEETYVVRAEDGETAIAKAIEKFRFVVLEKGIEPSEVDGKPYVSPQAKEQWELDFGELLSE